MHEIDPSIEILADYASLDEGTAFSPDYDYLTHDEEATRMYRPRRRRRDAGRRWMAKDEVFRRDHWRAVHAALVSALVDDWGRLRSVLRRARGSSGAHVLTSVIKQVRRRRLRADQ